MHWTPEGYRFLLDGVEQWATSEGLSHWRELIRLTCEVEDGAWAGTIPANGYGARLAGRPGRTGRASPQYGSAV